MPRLQKVIFLTRFTNADPELEKFLFAILAIFKGVEIGVSRHDYDTRNRLDGLRTA